jgi:hypothetical protein
LTNKAGVADDLDRRDRRDKREDRREDRQDKRKSRGCIVSVAMFFFLALAGLCGGVMQWAGCKVGVFRGEDPDAAEVQEGDTPELEGFMGQAPKRSARVNSEHRLTSSGEYAEGKANGPGFSVRWKSPRDTQGATVEDVLDAALTHLEQLQQTPSGGSGVAQTLYHVDKALETIRSFDLEVGSLLGTPNSQRDPVGGAGFSKPESDDNKGEGTGAGFGG